MSPRTGEKALTVATAVLLGGTWGWDLPDRPLGHDLQARQAFSAPAMAGAD
ncbi:hypothetical protein ACFYYM_40115 [Streptomyces erythrochromogenes]|uniref:hypothetical protein n=1 Tax=Streptomyces erythrochromogenes TaxID=285574 RepID=UPI00367F2074